MSSLGGNVAITLLAVASVSLWTVRVALAARGRRMLGAGIAALEAVTFVVVFRQIGADLGAVDRLVAYGIGVAVGTLVGLTIDRRLSRGQSEIRLFVPGHRPVARALHARGWPATAVDGWGPNGPVTALVLVVDDVRLPAALHDMEDIAPDGFSTVHPLQRVHATPLPPGLRQVHHRAPEPTPRHDGSPV